MFAAGADICLKVREEDVETIFEVIVESKDASIQAQLMDALQAMARVFCVLSCVSKASCCFQYGPYRSMGSTFQ